MDSSNLSVGNSLYVSTKYALARWVRRVSASWAANGVRINPPRECNRAKIIQRNYQRKISAGSGYAGITDDTVKSLNRRQDEGTIITARA